MARLAGLPRPVVSRAQEVLSDLEARNGAGKKRPRSQTRPQDGQAQLPMFGRTAELIDELLKLEISSLTPLEAITKLFELQEKARRED